MQTEDKPINTCVYVDWYKFRTCQVKTCKNFTTRTPSQCLAIDRVVPNGTKIISDAELHLYKFTDKPVCVRVVSIKRKRAMTRIKSVLVLDKYLDYIRETANQEPYEPSDYMKVLETQYPLKIKRLGFKSWMWPHLLDSELYDKFRSRSPDGEIQELDLATLLDLTQMKYLVLISQVKEIHNATSEASAAKAEPVPFPQRPDEVQAAQRLGHQQQQAAG